MKQIPNHIQHLFAISLLIVIVATGVALWENSVGNDSNQDKISIIEIFSAIGTLTIAYFTGRVSTTFQNKASEVQFNRVVNLIQELQKIHFKIESKNDKKAVKSLFEIWNNKQYINEIVDMSVRSDSNDYEIWKDQESKIYVVTDSITNSIDKPSIDNPKYVKNLANRKLYKYYYDPLVPEQIRNSLLKSHQTIISRSIPSSDENNYSLFNTLDAIDNWFREKGLDEYTFDNTNV